MYSDFSETLCGWIRVLSASMNLRADSDHQILMRTHPGKLSRPSNGTVHLHLQFTDIWPPDLVPFTGHLHIRDVGGFQLILFPNRGAERNTRFCSSSAI